MAVDYRLKAIPTVYNGRRYRSRLEAKWAAFFDLMCWQFEYEPQDMGTWSPDFLLIGTALTASVEVKPISAFDHNIAERMASACGDDKTTRPVLLGFSPFLVDVSYNPTWNISGAEIGWGARVCPNTGKYLWTPCYAGRCADCFDIYSISHVQPYPNEHSITRGLLYGKTHVYDPNPPWGWRRHAELVKTMWDNACNTVQWNPGT